MVAESDYDLRIETSILADTFHYHKFQDCEDVADQICSNRGVESSRGKSSVMTTYT